MAFPLEHLTWLAALVDGEGCIGVRRGKNQRGEGSYILRLRVSNSHRGLLERIKERFGGGVSRSHVSRLNSQTIMYEWFTTNEKAETLIRLILPYLEIKGRQAEIALQLRATCGDRLGSRWTHPGSPVAKDTLIVREYYRQRMLAANRGQ